uniref:Uncharacterized protein n=1 Tax=Helicotheca tamesis TaxID=374047 RepID=A0A7S2DWA5_9STRA|mmetsp:Transcript_10363/g.14498  ORF Transcript_10363/g.14498 Transcript_10363/m.14498 type:complete len:235 (+) Transcript_10363:104-808(+)
MNRQSNIFRPICNSNNSSDENSLPDDNDNYIRLPILSDISNDGNNDNDILDIEDDMLPSRMRNSDTRNTFESSRPPLIKPRLFFGTMRAGGEEVVEDPNNDRIETEDIAIEECEDTEIQEQSHAPQPPSDATALETHARMIELQQEDGGNRTHGFTTPPPPEPKSSIRDDVKYVSKRFDANDFLSFIPLPRNHKRMRSFTEAEKHREIQFLCNSTARGNDIKEPERKSSMNKAA